MQKFVIRLEGDNALLMHNSRLANPLDPIVREMKKLTGKRMKTEDDQWELARLEHAGSLYIAADIGPYIPSDSIWRSIQDGAKKTKMGTAIKQGLVFTTDMNPLAYTDAAGKPGPRETDDLWKDEYFRTMDSVKVGTSRVTRTRPIFHNWRTEAEGVIDTSLIDWKVFGDICETAGYLCGLGDWRPKFGRYTVTLTKVK